MFRALLFLIGFLPLVSAHAALQNQLKDHPSPYLAMHGDDPVQWQEWGEAAMAKAKAENKPLFISSGYFACHWCHVMRRESYADPAIAALLNEYFIPVKLDRELEPALDEYLIEFVQRSRGSVGWPLNVFVTPDGYPLVGLTYAQPTVFHRLLIRLSGAWKTRSKELFELAHSAAAEITAGEVRVATKPPTDTAPLVKKFKTQALRVADNLQGGFGFQNRFPMAPQLAALLSVQSTQSDRKLNGFLKLTLKQMAEQGMRDQLIGGFFRYTVDPGWQIPHFEKMLYNQALHVPLFLDAASILEIPEFKLVARDTLDFVLNYMAGPDGGFIASFSAVDDENVEGGSYLWSPEQLAALLDDGERALAGRAWSMQGSPNNEGGYLPVQRMSIADAAEELDMPQAEADAAFARIRGKLALSRAARSLPADTKPVAAWNGLMLTALARGVAAFGETYKKPGAELRDFLVQRLWKDGVLYRSLSAEGYLGTAALEDYAFVARGLWDWAKATGNEEDRVLAQSMAKKAWNLFYDNGWQPSAKPLLPAMGRQVALQDAPLPSASAVLIGLTLELPDEVLKKRAREALSAAYADVEKAPFSYPATVMLFASAIAHPSAVLQ